MLKHNLFAFKEKERKVRRSKKRRTTTGRKRTLTLRQGAFKPDYSHKSINNPFVLGPLARFQCLKAPFHIHYTVRYIKEPKAPQATIYYLFRFWWLASSRNNAPNVPKLCMYLACALWLIPYKNDLTDDKFISRSEHWIMLIATGEWCYLTTLAIFIIIYFAYLNTIIIIINGITICSVKFTINEE